MLLETFPIFLLSKSNNFKDKIKLIFEWLSEIIKEPFYCIKCLSFWITLLLSNDLIIASFVSYTIYMMDRKNYL